MSQKAYDEIIDMSYPFFNWNECSEDSIDRFFKMVDAGGLLGECGVSREDIHDELTRRHTVQMVGEDAVLDGDGDHEDWFNPIAGVGLNREIEWHFWSHYEKYLRRHKNWTREVVKDLNKQTNKILSRIEDPLRTGKWDTRGMVIGSVQSGKTANFTGLIAKAIDAGYKLIVVIAGVHNSLRSQTQFRLNEELLGYHLERVQEFQGGARLAGVRKMFPDHKIAQTLTNALETGDFRKSIADSAGIVPTKDGPPTILVIKKHVSILKNFLEWSTAIVGRPDGSGKLVVDDIPLLVIDDECDYASVNTKKSRDEHGNVDPELDPARTNQRIREILCAFKKSNYVGYTATPFANIFIHRDDTHPDYGDDLFPRDFIVSLRQPSSYLGPDKLFGLNENLAADVDSREPLPLLRTEMVSDDSAAVFPPSHKTDLQIATLPPSLKEAIRAFLLACAARRCRMSSPAHNSMLIHVTRFNKVQGQVRELVEAELKKLVDKIRAGDSTRLVDLKRLWEDDFQATTAAMKGKFGCKEILWTEIEENLYPIAKRIKIKSVNGKAKESLDYRTAEFETQDRIGKGIDVPWEERGENVISIGGDKLSRGLTLDGLTVSYYLRASKMYDTLMQMGRWFGYRNGYEDLCRIYTTRSLATWYRFIATASIELKNELKYMDTLSETPSSFGLKVLDHPRQLAITSAGKRRNSETLDLSYSGRISETIIFDLSKSRQNLAALDSLIRSADKAAEADETSSPIEKDSGTIIWEKLSPQVILDFLRSYQTHAEGARLVDPSKIHTFISDQLEYGSNDLTAWSLVVVGVENDDHQLTAGGRTFGCVLRAARGIEGDRLRIGRLVNPSDELLDFEHEDPNEVYGLKGLKVRAARPKNRGLLLIYPVHSPKETNPYGLDAENRTYGFAISFPESKTTRTVRYVVNSVFQDAED